MADDRARLGCHKANYAKPRLSPRARELRGSGVMIGRAAARGAARLAKTTGHKHVITFSSSTSNDLDSHNE